MKIPLVCDDLTLFLERVQIDLHIELSALIRSTHALMFARTGGGGSGCHVSLGEKALPNIYRADV